MVHVVDHAPNAHVTCDTHRYTDIYMIYVYVQVCLGRCAPVNNIYIYTHINKPLDAIITSTITGMNINVHGIHDACVAMSFSMFCYAGVQTYLHA